MRRAEEDSDEEVTRPIHKVTNTISSDEEEEGGQPDVLVGVNGEAPQDDENLCKFSAVLFLQHCCIRLVCVLVMFEFACLCSNFSWSLISSF